MEKRAPTPPLSFLAILLVSTAAIAYEILLIRILSIVQWHHFAWMIISLALLGYGASGAAIALAKSRVQRNFDVTFALAALLFSVFMVVCLALGQRVPFNALRVIWDPWQFLYLAELYLLFMVPFFFSASCIGLAFALRADRADRIYFFDLLGAGVGAALVIVLLFLLPPQRAVLGCAGLALVASVLAGRGSLPRSLVVLQLAWLLCLAWAAPVDRIGLRLSEFKGLSQALEVSGARVLTERSGPLGLLTVVASPRVPFREAPGLSFTTRFLPPDQLAVFTDGDGLSVINAFDGDPSTLGFLSDVPAALPYRLLERPRVLVLGAGAGSDVLLALHNGAASVDAVELNAQMVALVREDFADYAGRVYDNERVSVHIGEARGFVSRVAERFDLVQIALMDSLSVSGSGAQALSESYLYTVEAVQRYLDCLEPDGLLAITRWLKVPPRDSLKLAATVIEAMHRSGVADPGRRLVVIRSFNTVTLLAKNGEFDGPDVAALRDFTHRHSFDTAWYPGMPAGEANRYNRLDRPWLFEGISALLGGGRDAYIEGYKFEIEPSTDQRPYFFNFFKWRVLPEILALRERGGAGLIEWGYPVLVATVVQAALAGAVLILLPLAFARRGWPRGTGRSSGVYFFMLGLAFLFIEIAFMQKFTLFLSHPLYSVAVVLAGFLLFAGLGSASSGRLVDRCGGRLEVAVGAAVAGIAVLVVVYLWLLPRLFAQLMTLGDALRVLVSLLLIAPLAFCMGMPFPLGLRRLANEAPTFLPWAWGINGYASVIGAALATLLAVEFGATVVLLLALLCYLLAAMLINQSARTFICLPLRHR